MIQNLRQTALHPEGETGYMCNHKSEFAAKIQMSYKLVWLFMAGESW